jgi:hypothetical protein
VIYSEKYYKLLLHIRYKGLWSWDRWLKAQPYPPKEVAKLLGEGEDDGNDI